MGQKDASVTTFQMKARNGFSVRAAENGGIEVTGTGGVRDYTPPMAAFAIEEFCQAKHDAELGRWRWPENPDFVVYRTDDFDGFMILDEREGRTWTYRWFAIKDDPAYDGPWDAARAYFEAHPERKPWHDARPEEVWLMGSGLHEFVALVGDDGKFRFADGSEMAVTEEFITGRRLWPEDAS